MGARLQKPSLPAAFLGGDASFPVVASKSGKRMTANLTPRQAFIDHMEILNHMLLSGKTGHSWGLSGRGDFKLELTQ